MISRTTIAAGLIALTAFAAVPASAANFGMQFGFGHGQGWSGPGWSGHGHRDRERMRHRLSTQEVRAMLRDRGYRNIRVLDDRGPVYEVRARRQGTTFHLVVSARDGQILSRNRT